MQVKIARIPPRKAGRTTTTSPPPTTEEATTTETPTTTEAATSTTKRKGRPRSLDDRRQRGGTGGQFRDAPPSTGTHLLYLTAVSPHSQLLIAAATIGGAIVLAVGMLLGSPLRPPGDGGDTDPTLARVTFLDLEITPQAEAPLGDDGRR